MLYDELGGILYVISVHLIYDSYQGLYEHKLGGTLCSNLITCQ